MKGVLRIRKMLSSTSLRILVPLLLIVAACGEENSTPGSVTTRDLVGDVLSYQSLPTLEIQPLGAACPDRDERCLIGPSGAAITGSRGEVAFWDFGKTVHLIDDGVVKSIGRTGDGPGEYRVVVAAGWTTDDILEVYDASLQRRLRFDRDGRNLATERTALPPGYIVGFYAGNELRALSIDPNPERRGNQAFAKVILLSLNRNDAKPRSLATLPIEQPAFGVADMRPVPKPFEPLPQWAFAPDGRFAYSDGTKPIVELFDSTGKPEVRIGFDVATRAVTEAELEGAIAKRMKGISDPRMRSALGSTRLQGSEHHPGLTALKLLENGGLWIREAPVESGDSVRWLIFDRTGAPMGGVYLPTEVVVLAAYGDSILVNDPGEWLKPGGLIWVALVPRAQ